MNILIINARKLYFKYYRTQQIQQIKIYIEDIIIIFLYINTLSFGTLMQLLVRTRLKGYNVNF